MSRDLSVRLDDVVVPLPELLLCFDDVLKQVGLCDLDSLLPYDVTPRGSGSLERRDSSGFLISFGDQGMVDVDVRYVGPEWGLGARGGWWVDVTANYGSAAHLLLLAMAATVARLCKHEIYDRPERFGCGEYYDSRTAVAVLSRLRGLTVGEGQARLVALGG